MDIAGTVALVTGASSGIGAATAAELARRGATVVCVARTEATLSAVAAEIRDELGDARVYPCDCTDPEAVIALADQVTDEVGVPDIVVNSAGAGRWLFIEETDPDEIRFMMDLPFFAAWHVTRAFMRPMLRRGSGHLCNVGSPYAWMPWPGAVGYGASRWALRGLTEGLWVDLAGTGVHASIVIPAEIETAYFDNNPGARERFPTIERLIPSRRPEDLADTIADVITRDARFGAIPLLLRGVLGLARLSPGLVRAISTATGYRRAD